MDLADAERLAHAEGLRLVRSSRSATGFAHVYHHGARRYSMRDGINDEHSVHVLASPYEAALQYARFLGPPRSCAAAEAAERDGMSADEVQAQAAEEGLTLVPKEGPGRLKGVKYYASGRQARPYQACISKVGAKGTHGLGYYATAEEAALVFARTRRARDRQQARAHEEQAETAATQKEAAVKAAAETAAAEKAAKKKEAAERAAAAKAVVKKAAVEKVAARESGGGEGVGGEGTVAEKAAVAKAAAVVWLERAVAHGATVKAASEKVAAREATAHARDHMKRYREESKRQREGESKRQRAGEKERAKAQHTAAMAQRECEAAARQHQLFREARARQQLQPLPAKTAPVGRDRSGVQTAKCGFREDGSLDPQGELRALVAHTLLYEFAGSDPWRCLGLACGSAPEVVRKRYLHLARRGCTPTRLARRGKSRWWHTALLLRWSVLTPRAEAKAFISMY